MRSAVKASVVVLILLLGGGLLVAAIARVRETAARAHCTNNLRQLGITLHSYCDVHGHFPRATEPNPRLSPEKRLSWLVSVGPYVESTPFFLKLQWQEGWDAEENRYAALTKFFHLQCPAYPDQPPVSTLAPSHYVGLAGLGSDAAALPSGDRRAGFFGYDRKLTLADVGTGANSLIAVVETVQARGAWTAGGAATVRGLEEGSSPFLGTNGQLGGIHRGGANALFANGSVRFLRESLDPRVLNAAVTVQGSQKVGAVSEE
jgi:hypothetical protein